MAPARPAPETFRERLERWPGALLPYLLFFLTLSPFGPLRWVGWLALLALVVGDYRWGFRLLLFSLPFTAPGSYRWFFTVKPFQLLGALTVIGLMVAAWFRRLPPRRRTALELPLLLFAGVMALSLVNSPAPVQGVRMLGNFVLLIGLTLALTGWYPAAEIGRIPRLLLAGAAAMTPFQLINLVLQEYNRKGIPLATFEGGYTTADYLLFALPFVLLTMPAEKPLARWMKALLLAALAIDLVLTFNRGAWYAALAVLGGLALLAPRRLWSGWRTGVATLLVLVLAVTAAMSYSDYFAAQAYSYFTRRATPGWLWSGGKYVTHILGSGVGTEHWRLLVWRQVTERFFFPHWLLGSGIGTVGLPYYDPPAHNNLLQVAAETGLAGLGLLLWLYAVTGRALWRLRGSAAGLAALAALLGLLLHGLTFNTLVLFHHWVLLGLAMLFAAAPPAEPKEEPAGG